MSADCAWLKAALAEIFGDPTLSTHEKLVLLSLVQHGYGRAGECWPSFDTIARETGLCRRKVIYVVDALTKKRRLMRVRRPKAGDRHDSNLYRVDVCKGGEGAQNAPRWVHGMHPNRISKAGEISSLLISETSSLPPRRGEGAAVCSFVSADLVQLAESLFGEPRRRLVISALRKLGRELGEEVAPDELARFLRYQAKHRNVTALGAPISAACDAAEFSRWRRLHTRPAPGRTRDHSDTDPVIPRPKLAALAHAALRQLPIAARSATRTTRTPIRN